MTEEEISQKYSNIDDKIPTIWTTISDVNNDLAKDIATIWNITNTSLIRLISRMSLISTCKNNLTAHINSSHTFLGLYPSSIKSFNVPISEEKAEIVDFIILTKFLKNEDYYEIRKIEGNGVCGLKRFIFTTGLIVNADKTGYEGRYCYENNFDAVTAINQWNGKNDPPGNWIKYKGRKGEYRNPKYIKND